MATLQDIRAKSGWRDIFEGQGQHLILLTFLLAGAAWFLQGDTGTRRFLWMDSVTWAWVSVWLAVAHQGMVALIFRLQLHLSLMSRFLAKRDLQVWGWMFFPFLIARPVTVLIVAVLDRGSLGWPLWPSIGAGAVLLGVAGYTMYSVKRYFSFERALGGDHFYEHYRRMPIVREGAFRWSQNAMYTFGFMGLWGIALVCGSWQALIVAAFQHAYIWVHMYTVEGPDMRWLYGENG
ncbi:methyltransferase [Shimia aestuarii]|uniref:Phospholipid methyltransferase n=1 Tax=Shimia aestuarii TaxID=254406 RepID=A0A1I4MJU6_9RHOB|nr:methyltransferase [Shimia aestuarii]SFM03297.1 Phospholipid methyltransferase [Shimia aestuarii]